MNESQFKTSLILAAGCLLTTPAYAGNLLTATEEQCINTVGPEGNHVPVANPASTGKFDAFLCQDDYVNNETGEPGADGIADISAENQEFFDEVTGNSHEDVALVSQSREVTRRLTNNISQRLSQQMTRAFASEAFSKTDNKIAASSDNNGSLAFWGDTSITEIGNDGSNKHRDNDIYQFVVGFDKRINDLFIGSAVTYAYSETESTGADSSGHTVGVTPYIGYKLNDFLFASALAGYNYTHSNRDQRADSDIHAYYTEGNLNAFKVINSFILKGRAGVRYTRTNTSFSGNTDNTSDELTWIGDGEVGYNINSKLMAYSGVSFEHYDREADGSDSSYHDGVFYMRWGADYSITDNTKLGLKIETDLNDKNNDLFVGGLNFRMVL